MRVLVFSLAGMLALAACTPAVNDQMIEQMEGGMREVPAPVGGEDDDPAREPLVALFAKLHSCTSESVGRITVGQLLRELHGPRRPSRGEDYPSPAREF